MPLRRTAAPAAALLASAAPSSNGVFVTTDEAAYSIELESWVQSGFDGMDDHGEAHATALELLRRLESEPVAGRILEANLPGVSSSRVQNAFLEEAAALGFRSEATGLFDDYAVSALRPDYYRPLQNGGGILLEVERGKTTINNMDLLDFWKCHICHHANVLFLMVPRELRQNPTMSPRREFNTVRQRLSAFFEPGNETRVQALYLFGY